MSQNQTHPPHTTIYIYILPRAREPLAFLVARLPGGTSRFFGVIQEGETAITYTYTDEARNRRCPAECGVDKK